MDAVLGGITWGRDSLRERLTPAGANGGLRLLLVLVFAGGIFGNRV